MKNIEKSRFLALPIPTCSPDEKERIEHAARTAESALIGSRIQLAKLQAMRSALLRDLLTPPVSAGAEPRITTE